MHIFFIVLSRPVHHKSNKYSEGKVNEVAFISLRGHLLSLYFVAKKDDLLLDIIILLEEGQEDCEVRGLCRGGGGGKVFPTIREARREDNSDLDQCGVIPQINYSW